MPPSGYAELSVKQRGCQRSLCHDHSVTHIPDLAPYDYYPGAPEALAVGWLDASETFSTGECPPDVRDHVEDLSREPVRLTRGRHYCQFCEATVPPPKRLRADMPVYEAPDVASGNGEIWVTDHGGTNFAAPVLVLHYIDEHDYLPPTPFIDAVRSGSRTPGID